MVVHSTTMAELQRNLAQAIYEYRKWKFDHGMFERKIGTVPQQIRLDKTVFMCIRELMKKDGVAKETSEQIRRIIQTKNSYTKQL